MSSSTGHGKQYLSQVFLVLNLLAFLLHTALELVDDLYRFLRRALHRRVTFFNDMKPCAVTMISPTGKLSGSFG